MKTSSRRIYSPQSCVFKRLFKESSGRLGQDQYIRLIHTSSKRFQDVLSKRLQQVFKTSSRCLAKISSRHLQDVLQRCLQHIFNTYHHVKVVLSTRLREVFNEFLRRNAKAVVYRRICLGHIAEKFMVSMQNCKSDKNFSSFSFSFYYTLYWMLAEAYLEPGRTSMELFCENT